MSRIDKLIAELCPDGVEYRTLGEIGTFIRGNGLQKKDLTHSGVPAIHYGQVHTHYGIWTTETISFVAPEFAKRLRQARPGDLIIATTSEDDDGAGKAVAWLGDEPAAISGDAYVYQHSLEPKYIAYYFQSEQFREQKRRGLTGTKVRRVSGDSLGKIRIPVPPLEVQREIVRILDLFTTLEAELEAELEARRRQYAHYRDSLLVFPEGGVRWVPMGDLLREPLTNGRSVPDGTGYPVLRLTALRGPVVDTSHRKPGAWGQEAGSRFRIEAGDLLIVRGNGSKDLIARACMVEDSEEVAFPDTMIRVRPDLEQVSQRYLFHIWESRAARSRIERLAKRTSGVWKISQDDIARVELPIPPLEEQARIVAILDAFDALVNDLSVGLPAELAARRKQYEYYRDRLLTFKEAAA